jgi:N-acetylglucosamine kinase-like BadF-type ATPase
MEYFLGIDQGGTKTAAIVCCAEGEILGAGHDAGLAGVYFSDSEELYLRRVADASKSACEAAGITLGMVSRACGGMNGADWDFEYPVLRERLSRALGLGDVTVLNDCVAAMRGGSANPACAVICAGSGLNAAVRHSAGREIVFGYYVDQSCQGASALGVAALRKVAEAGAGLCGETMLTGLILGYTGYETAEKLLIGISMREFQPEYKSFAPLLIEAYAAGDAEARDVAEAFSRGAARYIPAGMKRLGLSGSPLDVVFSGGVFKGAGTLIADRIFDYVSDAEPHVRKIHAKYEPVCGAALTLLDRHYGGAVPERVGAAFGKSAETLGLLRPLGPAQ